jgi:hypothetical protein
LRDPALQRDGDDWLAWAAQEPLKDLKRRLRERLEAKAQAESGVQEVTVFVHPRVVDDFQRARVVASRKEGKALSDGQTFERCVIFYLDKNDPLRVTPRARRLGPTSERPFDRTVPAEVKRAVKRRARDRCEVPGCTNEIFVDLAHITPHCLGSGREADDLFQGCHPHHVLKDAGLLDVVIRRDGGRDYVFAHGLVLRGPAPEGPEPPPAGGSGAGPADGANGKPSSPASGNHGAGAGPGPPRDDGAGLVGEQPLVFNGRRVDCGAALPPILPGVRPGPVLSDGRPRPREPRTPSARSKRRRGRARRGRRALEGARGLRRRGPGGS